MNYCSISTDDMKNGHGLRTVLWVSGCEHKCEGCHNPSTWDREGGTLFDESAKELLLEYIAQDHISGLTLSGGDPLVEYNRTDILELVKEVKAKYPKKTIWLYSGYTYKEVSSLEIFEYVDVFVDGPYIESKKESGLKWAGSSNQIVHYLI